MAAKKLPISAFEYYVGLGADRSFASVAGHFDVSPKTVSRAATKEDWSKRLEEVEHDALSKAGKKSAATLAETESSSIKLKAALQEAMSEVMTPKRLKAVFITLFKSVVEDGNVTAARILIERVLGKIRSEPLQAGTLVIPDGLETASEVRAAANAILQALTKGVLAPEDAQRAVTIIESARRSVETEELEERLMKLEEDMKKGSK
jgi:hypothetical protein